MFRDVIQPILNEKCLNCHNANRAKNDLILTDYQSIMKGGETRDAIVAGKAEESLLYKYLLLPMNDSLHMPPKEKLQLDREEIKLIGWWINTGAKAHEKYVNLPKVDSIQTIMLSRFHPKNRPGSVGNFLCRSGGNKRLKQPIQNCAANLRDQTIHSGVPGK